MSLQIWLPLNGDLHNQGLTQIAATNNGAAINNNGKIGKCYDFSDNVDNRIIFPSSELSDIQSFSICCWIKPTTWNKTYITPVIFANGTDWNKSIGFSTYDTSETSAIGFIISNGSAYKATYVSKTRIPLDAWSHITGTFDGRYLRFYVNGERIGYTDCGSSFTIAFPSTGYIGGWFSVASTLGFVGSINDVRLYDYCLSPKEVEEIAKGLVLHYKLDNNGMGRENLFSLDSVLTGITQSNHTTVTINNNIINVKTSGVNYGNFSQKTDQYITFQAGTSYTLSGHIKSITKGEDNYTPILTIRNSSSIIQKSLRVSGNESDVEGTYTPSETFVGYISGIITYSSGSSNTTIAEAEFSNIKLETGTIKTNWSPALTDSIYPAGYKTTVYDSSGYSHNGTITGSLAAAAPSPRYEVATVFDDTYPRITAPFVLNNMNELTISLWIKANQSGYPIMFSHSGYNTFRFWLNNTRFYFRNYSDADGSSRNVIVGNWQDGNWNHVAITYNKGTVIGYFNGEKTNTYTSATSEVLSGCTSFRIGQNSSGNYPFLGQESDLRLYTTVLTDTQIKELYNTSLSIDANGNVYARELVE